MKHMVLGLVLAAVMAGCQSVEAKLTLDEARAKFAAASSEEATSPYHPTTDPGAQWFPEAGFGLFMHWGMYSVNENRPSWGVLHNRFKQKTPRDIGLDEYYALAKKFNPQRYNPDEWMKLAKSLGMTYVVLTTKHHDGYCLWPSAYGDYNTKSGANGRDLLREYVDAARRHGLKVGFYYSPRDWGYNNHQSGFLVPMQKFDRDIPAEFPYPESQNKEEYLKWIDFTVGQLSELLTQYGPIDVLWFDGATWQGKGIPNNEYGNKIRNWIYSIQPQILLNPRWGEITNPDYAVNAGAEVKKIARSAGDFYTFESNWKHITDPHQNAGVYEPIWFEFCDIWKGWNWGYEKAQSDQPDWANMHRILDHLSTLRALGGNYLLNIGPSGDGEYRPDVKAEAAVLSAWIQPRKAAFFGITPVKQWEKISPAPLTCSEKTLYVHLTGEKLAVQEEVRLAVAQEPVAVRVLAKPDAKVAFKSDNGELRLTLPVATRDPLGEIIEIQFKNDCSL